MTPRETATRTLAEALDAAPWEPVTDPMDIPTYEEAAAMLLAASPALARWLELGAAWDAVEAALPDGWAINMLWGTVTEDRWGAHAGPFPPIAGAYHHSATAGGPTPTAALVALAEALREVPR